jgi:serine/threonine protein kinase
LPAGELVNVNNKTYKIECEIGSGGSCLVYRALEQTQNGQHVALKVVDLASAGKELTKVFKNEIQFLQKLQDSNYVIKMFDQ